MYIACKMRDGRTMRLSQQMLRKERLDAAQRVKKQTGNRNLESPK